MSFFRAQRAQTLRSSVCSSSNLAICSDFRRLGVNQITYDAEITVPAAPIITSFSVSGTTLTLNLRPIPFGGSVITNYQYSLNNGINYRIFSPAVTASPLIITGLTAGSSYSVLIKAINDVGAGSSSIMLPITVPSVPLAPFDLSYTTSPGLVTISFTEGSNGGRPITNYKYSTDGGSNFTVFSPAFTRSPVTIRDLVIGQTYSIVLQAINDLGSGASSSALSVYVAASVPAAPTGISVSNITSTSADLSFTTGSNGGNPITNYIYSIDNGATFIPLNPVDAISPVTIPGLSAGLPYSVVLQAVNSLGNSVSSSAVSFVTNSPFAPLAPTGLSASNITSTSAEISFTAGSNGGSPITNYRYSTDGGTTFTALTPANNTSPVTIPGLNPGQTYSVVLQAVNSIGTGSSSSAVSITTMATVPLAPTGITSSNITSTSVDLSFSAGLNGGSPITNYMYSINGAPFIPLSPADNASPITVPGLTPGVTHNIVLQAVNSIGNGLSSPIIFVSALATAPSAPTGLSASNITSTSAQLSFTAGLNGGSAITNYRYSLDNGTTFTALSPADAISPVTIPGLTPGQTYSVVLQAVNSVGNGASSSAVSVSALATAPSAPTGLSASNITSTSAQLSFTAGLNGGSAITNYRYSLDNGTTFTALSPADAISPVTIPGLSAGQTYSVVLQAVNSVGNSANSAAVSVSIPAPTVPTAPTGLSASNIGSSSVTVSFTPGSNGGSPITNYKYSTDGTNYSESTPTTTSSPVTITGLSSGTTYSIYIKAVNSIGDGVASPALSITTTKIPGSLVFDGTTRELALNPGVSVGNGAYTVECWFYNNSAWNTESSNPINFATLLGHSASASSGQNVAGAMAICFLNSKTIRTDWNGGGHQPSYTFSNDITLNAWHHFVLVRNSSQIETAFIDGVKAISCGGGTSVVGGQQVNSKDYYGYSVEIGHFYQGYWPGYLTNFRIVVGTAVYDPTASSITVPTTALTNITDTKYLMVGDAVTGDGSSTQTVTNIGGVTISTGQVPL